MDKIQEVSDEKLVNYPKVTWNKQDPNDISEEDWIEFDNRKPEVVKQANWLLVIVVGIIFGVIFAFACLE